MSHKASERLAALRGHLASAPRNKRLEGYVCVITGAGSIQVSSGVPLMSIAEDLALME